MKITSFNPYVLEERKEKLKKLPYKQAEKLLFQWIKSGVIQTLEYSELNNVLFNMRDI